MRSQLYLWEPLKQHIIFKMSKAYLFDRLCSEALAFRKFFPKNVGLYFLHSV